MPPRFIAQVSLERDGAIPEDVIVNSWHFEGDDNTAFETDRARWDDLAPGLTSRLVTFYQSLGVGWAQTLSGNGEVKLYDFSDAKPRIPRYQEPFVFTPGTSAQPGEVALCLSFSAAAEAGANPARRRGRVFLGPLSASSTVVMTEGADARPPAAFRQSVIDAALVMATGVADAARLAIFSPRTLALGGTVDEAWNDAVNLWVDNAFDTQRRRGADATARTTATIA